MLVFGAGGECLMSAVKRRVFPESFKREAVDRMATSGLSAGAVASLAHHRVYATRAEARTDLFGYIEGFYNPVRLHSALGYLSPAEMERRAA